MHHQDRWLLLAELALLGLACLGVQRRAKPLGSPSWLPLAAAPLLLVVCLAGHYWILSGHDLSRDEQMATFDAAVFAGGHLVQPLPAFWHRHADALNTMFMYPAQDRGAWISAYLPLNAAIRAAVGMLGTQTLTGPLLTALGALALWGCVRRLWPDDREAPVVALLLYLGSGQVLFAGMTAYAMTAHLACNLVWLWLFLARRWRSDVLALGVGFIAVGLHQPLMHPMFAGPLLFLLVLERDWRRAAFYAVGYALIGAFWMWWPGWTWSLSQASASAAPPVSVDYLARLVETVAKGSDMHVALMDANLLRFIGWQHLLLLPLVVAGCRVVRTDRTAMALLGGAVLTFMVMAVILPYQGHGFGYRYLHGLIGNVILIAVLGWRAMGEARAKWRPLLLRTSLAAVAVILPMQAWMAHAQYSPYAQLDARIDASGADYVVIGPTDAPYAADLVINPPGLDQRPVRLLRGGIDPELATMICANQARVALIDAKGFRSISDYFGWPANPGAPQGNARAAELLATAGCRVSYLD